MKFLDLTLPTPAENLAADEALLEFCEAQPDLEVLRFWEPQEYFVVLGYANRYRLAVNLPACQSRNIPILRRCSGGGTVLQGPGCLNYSLVLRIPEAGSLAGGTKQPLPPEPLVSWPSNAQAKPASRNADAANAHHDENFFSSDMSSKPIGITETNVWIMQRQRRALQTLLPEPVSIQGITDLALGDRKFSGNAQRRKRACLLFHGAFLLDFDLSIVDATLAMPPQQPGYRQNRTHQLFLTNLKVAPATLKNCLRNEWGAATPLETFPHEQLETLLRGKYSRSEWNYKF